MTLHIYREPFTSDVYDFIIEISTDTSIANDVVFDDMINPFDEIRVIYGLLDREMPSGIGDVVKSMLCGYINLHLQRAIDHYVKYFTYYYDDEMLDILAKFHNNVSLPQDVADDLLKIVNMKEMPQMAAILLKISSDANKKVSGFEL